MKIQLIGLYSNQAKFNAVTTTTISEPASLDEYDVTVIDLSESGLWRCYERTRNSIDMIKDFDSVQGMVARKSKAKIVYALPQNTQFFCDGYHGPRGLDYHQKVALKDAINSICHHILPRIIPEQLPRVDLIYENTHTTIAGNTYDAAFYFDKKETALTESDCSKKPTTIELLKDEVYATTLKITETQELLFAFLEHLLGNRNGEQAPEWFFDIKFGDDTAQTAIIQSRKKDIENAEHDIAVAEKKLAENKKYKSILYTNGEILVEVVFDILQQLLGYDLSGFVDRKKEDFLIETDEYTLIGEIKGVTSNVRSENVSQIDNHYYSYIDNHPDSDTSKIHQILIINPLRKQPPDEREPVHENQILLAQRNGCLIVETAALLRLFEQFEAGTITSKECVDLFCSSAGLLKLDLPAEKTELDLEAYKLE